MDRGYRFDEFPPHMGAEVAAFRTLADCEQFVREQGGLQSGMQIWEVEGTIVEDDGGPDGLTIRVTGYRAVH